MPNKISRNKGSSKERFDYYMFRKTGLQILENGLIGPKNDHLDDQEGRILYSSKSHKGYRIRGYCDRFLLTK